MKSHVDGRPLCWEGDPGETKPGCGGCRYSAIQRGGSGRACRQRYQRFYYGVERRNREMQAAFEQFMSKPDRDADSVILGLADIYRVSPSTVREIVREQK